MDIRWMTVFVDRPADGFDRMQEFWRQVTGTTMSPTRGADDQFASFVPPDGDVVLKSQRTGDGSSSSHLDIHVSDTAALAAHAENVGATRVDEFGEVVVLQSPGGFSWCAVPVRVEAVRPAPVGVEGRRTIVDQLCLDIAPERFDDECGFWSALTGWQLRPGIPRPFARLDVPASLPLRLLLQRRDDAGGDEATRSHLDLACDDVDASVAHHVGFGAELVDRLARWAVMRDPSGVVYCLTSRDPDTGAPPARP